jgi:hypothetical protein
VVLSDLARVLRLLRTEESQYMVPTIYVEEPWSASSEALVARGPLKGGLPPEVAERRLVRLTEVALGICAGGMVPNLAANNRWRGP